MILGKKGDVLDADRRQGFRNGVHIGCMSIGSTASCDFIDVSEEVEADAETV